MNDKKTKSKLNILYVVVMVILIIIFLPLFIITTTLVIKSAVNPDYPPDIFGYAPLTVASGSMSGDNEDSFDKGDLIFVKVLSDDEKDDLQKDDVICYVTSTGSFITHRIVSVTRDSDGGVVSVITMGDANYPICDDEAVLVESIYGIYTGNRLCGLGYFAEFLQSAAGIVVFIVLPVGAFVLFEVYRVITGRKKTEKGNEEQTETALQDKQDQDKDAEIARLKKIIEEQQKSNSEGKD